MPGFVLEIVVGLVDPFLIFPGVLFGIATKPWRWLHAIVAAAIASWGRNLLTQLSSIVNLSTTYYFDRFFGGLVACAAIIGAVWLFRTWKARRPA